MWGGGGWSSFEINNFGRTLCEINNLLILVVRGVPFNLHVGGGGGGWSSFEINNFGRTLCEINNLLQ